MILSKDKLIDLRDLGKKLKLWFIERDWDVKTNVSQQYYTINARKTGYARRVIAACRALVVVCYHEGMSTKVKIEQGTWTENIVSNIGWFLATGGTNLAFSLWSYKVQKNFKNYAQSVLDQY